MRSEAGWALVCALVCYLHLAGAFWPSTKPVLTKRMRVAGSLAVYDPMRGQPQPQGRPRKPFVPKDGAGDRFTDDGRRVYDAQSNQRPSKQERKTRQFEESKQIFDVKRRVVRVEYGERRSLESFTVGEKVNGRVISIVPHGAFIDIGTLQDCLVHVKDLKENSFVESAHTVLHIGQDVEAYVKFVDLEMKKIGLSMFPQGPKLKLDAKPLTEFKLRDKVVGKVVKATGFGAYMDIGAEFSAFLHIKDYHMRRELRDYKPFEIFTAGMPIEVMVKNVNIPRQRIQVATTDPDEWDPEESLYITNDDEAVVEQQELLKAFAEQDKIWDDEDEDAEVEELVLFDDAEDDTFDSEKFRSVNTKRVAAKASKKRSIPGAGEKLSKTVNKSVGGFVPSADMQAALESVTGLHENDEATTDDDEDYETVIFDDSKESEENIVTKGMDTTLSQELDDADDR